MYSSSKTWRLNSYYEWKIVKEGIYGMKCEKENTKEQGYFEIIYCYKKIMLDLNDW